MTNRPQPQDAIFIDFEKNWRQFISASPELTLPVIRIEPKPDEPKVERWEPLIMPECVFSEDAGGLVPQVTIMWNQFEDAVVDIPIPVIRGAISQEPPQTAAVGSPSKPEESVMRFDLTVHHDGFKREYYSTALASDALKRFNLPANSGLVDDTESMLLTGPALFPKLLDFRIDSLQARDTQQQFTRQTLVLRDLSEGLTYTMRLCTFAGRSWTEQKEVVFLTPVCPDSF